jgi:hypothetical protein
MHDYVIHRQTVMGNGGRQHGGGHEKRIGVKPRKKLGAIEETRTNNKAIFLHFGTSDEKERKL